MGRDSFRAHSTEGHRVGGATLLMCVITAQLVGRPTYWPLLFLRLPGLNSAKRWMQTGHSPSWCGTQLKTSLWYLYPTPFFVEWYMTPLQLCMAVLWWVNLRVIMIYVYVKDSSEHPPCCPEPSNWPSLQHLSALHRLCSIYANHHVVCGCFDPFL